MDAEDRDTELDDMLLSLGVGAKVGGIVVPYTSLTLMSKTAAGMPTAEGYDKTFKQRKGGRKKKKSGGGKKTALTASAPVVATPSTPPMKKAKRKISATFETPPKFRLRKKTLASVAVDLAAKSLHGSDLSRLSTEVLLTMKPTDFVGKIKTAVRNKIRSKYYWETTRNLKKKQA